MTSGATLRLARQARGFSQEQLAGMAGVSRQAVSAVESGQSDPSLRVALALAGARRRNGDELFGPEETVPSVSARLVRPSAAPADVLGTRVTLAPIGDSFVAFPLSGPTVSRAGFLPAGGLVTGPGPEPSAVGGHRHASGSELLGGGRRHAPGSELLDGDQGHAAGHAVRPIGPPRITLIVAGCDPALPLLEAPLGLLEPPVAFSWWPCASHEALRLAAQGLVHVAGAHLRGRSGSYNTDPAGDLLPAGGQVIGFSAWRSEEHTSELQSPCNLVCRLLLEKKMLAKQAEQLPLPASPPCCQTV